MELIFRIILTLFGWIAFLLFDMETERSKFDKNNDGYDDSEYAAYFKYYKIQILAALAVCVIILLSADTVWGLVLYFYPDIPAEMHDLVYLLAWPISILVQLKLKKIKNG